MGRRSYANDNTSRALKCTTATNSDIDKRQNCRTFNDIALGKNPARNRCNKQQCAPRKYLDGQTMPALGTNPADEEEAR